MPSRTQNARDFGKESGKVRVVGAGFDVDHRVEGLVVERQVLGVALHEIQAGQIVPLSANATPAGLKSSPVHEAGRKVRTRYEAPPPWPHLTSSTCLPARSAWVAVRW